MQKPPRQARPYPDRWGKPRTLPGVLQRPDDQGARLPEPGAPENKAPKTKEGSDSTPRRADNPRLLRVSGSFNEAQESGKRGIPSSGNGDSVSPGYSDDSGCWVSAHQRSEYEKDLIDQHHLLKELVRKLVEEKEMRRSPLMSSYPWGVRVATAVKKENGSSGEENKE